MLELRALLEARWGTAQSAVEAYLDVARFAELLGSDPYLSYHWLRYDVERRADIALWEMMDKHEIDGEALDSIKQSIARRADTTRLKELIVEEVDLETPRYFATSESNNALTGKMVEMMGLYEPAKTHKAAVKLASYVDKPYAEMKTFTDEVSDEESEEAELLGDVADRARYARSEQLRGAMMADVLPLALALKQYKAKTGAYPDALALLMPDYIATVPRDPRTDAEIKYMPWQDGFFLFAQEVLGDDEEDSYSTYDSYYGYDYHDSGSSFGNGYTDDTLWHAEL